MGVGGRDGGRESEMEEKGGSYRERGRKLESREGRRSEGGRNRE